jgi:hypothetical protein
MTMDRLPRTEEELAELLAELPPAPEAWVQAARAIGRRAAPEAPAEQAPDAAETVRPTE